MEKNNGRDKVDKQFNHDEEAGYDDEPREDKDEGDVRVVYVREPRRGPFRWFGDTRERLHNTGRRWVELSVDQPLKNQHKLPDWMLTNKGRWLIVGALAVILVGWMVVFAFVS